MKKTILALALLASVSHLSAKLISEAQVRGDYERIKIGVTSELREILAKPSTSEPEKVEIRGELKKFEQTHPAYVMASEYMKDAVIEEDTAVDKLETALYILRTGYFWGISSSRKATPYEAYIAGQVLSRSVGYEEVIDDQLRKLSRDSRETHAEKAHKGVIKDFFEMVQKGRRSLVSFDSSYSGSGKFGRISVKKVLRELYPPQKSDEEPVYKRLFEIFKLRDFSKSTTSALPIDEFVWVRNLFLDFHAPNLEIGISTPTEDFNRYLEIKMPKRLDKYQAEILLLRSAQEHLEPLIDGDHEEHKNELREQFREFIYGQIRIILDLRKESKSNHEIEAEINKNIEDVGTLIDLDVETRGQFINIAKQSFKAFIAFLALGEYE